MSILKQDIIKKKRLKKFLEQDPKQELNTRNNEEFKVKAICKSKTYVKKTVKQLLGFYYLVFFKNYVKKKHLKANIGCLTPL